MSEDDRRFVFILDNERREFEVKIAMAKRDVVFWGKQIEEINEKEDLILGRGGELSEDDMNDIRILDFERRSYKLKIDSAGSEFEFYEEEIQGNMSKLNAILGGGDGVAGFVQLMVKSEVRGMIGNNSNHAVSLK